MTELIELDPGTGREASVGSGRHATRFRRWRSVTTFGRSGATPRWRGSAKGQASIDDRPRKPGGVPGRARRASLDPHACGSNGRCRRPAHDDGRAHIASRRRAHERDRGCGLGVGAHRRTRARSIASIPVKGVFLGPPVAGAYRRQRARVRGRFARGSTTRTPSPWFGSCPRSRLPRRGRFELPRECFAMGPFRETCACASRGSSHASRSGSPMTVGSLSHSSGARMRRNSSCIATADSAPTSWA